MANSKRNEPSGYPADSDVLREEFDRMLDSDEVRRNIQSAEGLLDNFVHYMKQKYPVRE
jgi:hypothetical protein